MGYISRLRKAGTVWTLATVALGVLIASLAGPIARADDEGWSQEKEIAEARRMIEENGLNWTAGPTTVNAIPPDERDSFYGLNPMSPEEMLESLMEKATGVLEALPRDEIPSSWDWRELGGTTPAKNQYGCGSCWAFAAVAALESLYKITTGTQVLFSEKQCIRCNEYGDGCGGGNGGSCYDLWTWFGAVTSTCIPYQYPYEGPCEHSDCDIEARITGTTVVPNIPDYLKTAVMIHPIYIVLYAGGAFGSYQEGCYAGPNQSSNHAVLLCGWDDDECDGNGGWLIKNSWGSGWGYSGFGWIQYGTTSLHGPSATLNFDPLPEALVAYRSHEVLDDRGNGLLDPGETAQIAVTVTNYASGSASGVSGVLRSPTLGVTITDDTADFANMASWESTTSAPPHFTVELDPAMTLGELVEFELEMHSDQAVDTSSFFEFVGGVAVVYETDFEGSPAGWTHGASPGIDDWQLGDAVTLDDHWDPKDPASGENLYGNDLNWYTPTWDGLHPNDSHNYLESPAIDCSEQFGVQLVFKRWLAVEKSRWDVANILVNGTEIWRNDFDNHHLDRSWIPVAFDISDLADDNPAVRVRFELESDAGWKFGGWNIDDFQIVTPGDPSALQDRIPAPLALSLSSHPNPLVPTSSLRLAIPVGSSTANVRVFDASGRLVRTLHEGSIQPGVHQLSWTGKGDDGQALPAGAYYCRAECGEQTAVTKLLLVR